MIKRVDDNVRFVHQDRWVDGQERTDGKRKNLVVTDRFADQLVDFEGLRRCERAVKNAEYNKNRRKVKIGTPEENADRLRALGIKVIS